MQPLFRIGIHHFKSCQGLAPVHPHVHICIEPCRKTPFRFIELVAAHPEIRHNAINRCDPMQAKETLQVTKVLRYEKHPFVYWLTFLCGRQVFRGIRILVKSNQSSFRSQLLKNGLGMSAATKCAVDIDTTGPDIQRRYCFLKQYWYVVSCFQNY